MLRSASFLLASVMALSLGSSPQDPARLREIARQQFEQQRQQAIQLNDLAGHLSSIQDSRNFVNKVAETFADELPPSWATHDLRERIANAEYLSATGPTQLIPEQRIADAWNKFARAINAPQDALVTPTEIHYLRDSHYTSDRMLLARGYQNIWIMPNIYAIGPDGKVADGCRAMEALRITWDLANFPQNMRNIREQVKTGVLLSDSLKKPAASTSSHLQRSFVTVKVGVLEDPVRTAEFQYVHEHGEFRMMELANDLVNDLLAGNSST